VECEHVISRCSLVSTARLGGSVAWSWGEEKKAGRSAHGRHYERLIAKDWEIPTTLKTGKEASGTSGLKCRDPMVFNSEVASVYRRTRSQSGAGLDTGYKV
jgi:hypothetical protein